MRLNVGMFGPKELFGALEGKLFGHVHIFTASVPAAFWVALGVLISQDRTLRLHDGQAGEIFTGDEFDVLLLALTLVFDYIRNGGINKPEPQLGRNHPGFHLTDSPFMAPTFKSRA